MDANVKLIVGLGNIGSKYENSRHNIGFMFLDFLANIVKTEFSYEKKVDGEVSITASNTLLEVSNSSKESNSETFKNKQVLDFDAEKSGKGINNADKKAIFNISLNAVKRKEIPSLNPNIADKGMKVILLKPHTFMNLSGNSVKKALAYYKVNVSDVFIIHDDLDMEFGKLRLKIKGRDGGHRGIRSIYNSLGFSEITRVKIGIGRPRAAKIPVESYVLSKFTSEELVSLQTEIFPKALQLLDPLN